MAETYVFEHGVVLLCQCLPPCHQPFRDPETNQWSLVGCLKPKDHEGDHGLDAPERGGFAYREPPEPIGPRIVMRREQPGGDIYRGTCPRCLREYAMAVTSVSSDAAAEIRAGIAGGPDTEENRRWGPVRADGWPVTTGTPPPAMRDNFDDEEVIVD